MEERQGEEESRLLTVNLQQLGGTGVQPRCLFHPQKGRGKQGKGRMV
jgi:hypothetical protein